MLTKLLAITCLLWAGMIVAISFLESWVKFRAPSLTKEIGLDVGRTVFTIFHKVQNFLLVVVISMTVLSSTSMITWLIMTGITATLCVQFFWLLPQLNKRVDVILSGNQPKPSFVHGLYGITEIIKLSLLLCEGFILIPS